MKILISGGYKKTSYLLSSLSGEVVTLIHPDQQFAEAMALQYNISAYIGSASDFDVISNLENSEFDIALLLGNNDAHNLVASKMLNRYLQIDKIFCNLTNPINQPLFADNSNVEVISTSHIISDILSKSAITGSSINYININDTDVKPYEFTIRENSQFCNKKLRDIKLVDDTIVCCIMRGKHGIVPGGDERLIADDKVVVFSTAKERELYAQFNTK